MVYTVSEKDLAREIRLNETDRTRAILQNVALILATARGSVPMYRDFGLSSNFVDKPEGVARNMLPPLVREAVEQWEPRAAVADVSFITDPDRPGSLVPVVEVEIIDEQEYGV